MALTKVKLIADGTIVQSNLHASHGITTADIGEGSNLYYTDARARAAVSVSGNALSYNSSTGVITSNFEESPTFTGNVVIDGTLGIGETPSNWSTFTVLQVEKASLASTGGDMNLMSNSYYDGTAYKYIESNAAARQYYNTDGTMHFYNASIGTAGGTVTWNERMRIDSSGNVGIGETSPNGKLDIKQDMTAGTTAAFTSPHLRLSANNTVDNTGFVGMTFATSTANNYGFSWGALRTTSALGGMHLRYHGNSASGTDIFNIDYVGNVTIATQKYIRSDSSGGWLTIQGGATYPGGRIDMYGGSNAAAGIEFLTGGTTSTPTLRFRIDDNGDAYFTEKLGIGTTSPDGPLHISFSDSNTGYANASAVFITNTNSTTNNRAHIFFTDSVGGPGAVAISTQFVDHTNNYGDLLFSTRGSGGLDERMRINSVGDIIIKDYGNIYASTNNSTVNSGIYFGGTDNTLRFYTNNDEKMRITSGGKVGIGTENSQNAELAIKSGSNFDLELYSESGGTAWQSYNRTTSNWGYLRFIAGGGEQMRISAGNGNIGIGETNPQYGKLQIKTASAIGYTPTSFINGTNLRLTAGGTAATNVTTGVSFGIGGAAEAYIGAVQNSSAYADVVFQTYHGAYGERMRMTSAGNLGIGTSSPAEKLHVENGNIRLKSNSDGNTGILRLYDAAGTESGQIYPTAADLKIYSPNDILFTQTGNVGIGTLNPQEKLHVAGRTITGSSTDYASLSGGFSTSTTTRENGGVVTLVSNGEYRYYERVCQISTGSGSAGYWHIKTNINWSNSFVMYMAKFYGYIYGQAAIMDITVAGYAYTSGPISTNVINNSTNSSSAATYASTDGKLVFRIDLAGSTYYAGLWMDIGFQNPTGGNLDFEILGQGFNTGTTYY